MGARACDESTLRDCHACSRRGTANRQCDLPRGPGKAADAKDADKKDAAAQTTDTKKDEKKDEKKEEKKLKEQEKDIQEIAVNLEIPRKTPKGTIVLRDATVVTMKGG